MSDIYTLRHVELDPRDAAKLWPFLNAYRPHDAPPTRADLQNAGYTRIEEESLMDFITDEYEVEAELAETR